MHPEIIQDKPGRCPECHMRLIKKSNQRESIVVTHSEDGSYRPLLVVISLIFVTSVIISLAATNLLFSWRVLAESFMIGFFLVFSGFKIIDLKGFAEGYATYDLLAKRIYSYGYTYPFIELLFGLGMIMLPKSQLILLLEIAVMTFSGLGVAIKLVRREKFQCACLGTFLKVPLTKVTLIEDFGMAALALILLLT